MNLLRIREIVVVAAAGDQYIAVTIVVYIIHDAGAIEYMPAYVNSSISRLR